MTYFAKNDRNKDILHYSMILTGDLLYYRMVLIDDSTLSYEVGISN
jgi:hypothetical protein